MSDTKGFGKTSIVLIVLVVLAVSTITTNVAHAAGPTPVNLGTAGNFVILAKTGISTTGTTSVVGDIGVSPIDSTAITGFGLTMDSSNTFSTSALVTGRVYAADYASPTPTMLTTAVSDMETAYDDAAGRTNPDHTELGAGDITSLTLAPGLYKWSTGVLIGAAGVTLSGGASDVWIFQIAQDLTVGNGAIVTLSGSAQAANIFWQVAGQVTLGTTSQFKGIILCKTLIEMNTGANLEGKALAQTAVTLDSNNVVSEFPSILILPLFMIPMLLAVIIYKKRSLGCTKGLRVPS
jgi:Ice-binding-like